MVFRGSAQLVLFSFLVALGIPAFRATTNAQNENGCRLCEEGSRSSPFPTKVLDIIRPGDLPYETCGDIEATLDASEKNCTDFGRIFGTFCGCPSEVEEPCQLCPQGQGVSDKLQLIPFLEGQFGFVPTCGIFEESVKLLDSSTSQCTQARSGVDFLCGGCSDLPPQEELNPPSPLTDLEINGEACGLCGNGERSPNPDKVFDIVRPGDIPYATCGEMEANVNVASSECTEFGRVFGSFCGCPIPEDSCNICPAGQTVSNKLQLVPFLEAQFGFVPTCGIIQESVRPLSSTSSQCSQLQGAVNALCGGCEDLPPEPLKSNGREQARPLTDLEQTGRACGFCGDGIRSPNPEQTLDIVQPGELPFATCGQLEANIDIDSQTCADYANAFGGYCGCPLPEDPCRVCPEGQEVEDRMQLIPALENQYGFVPTCGVLEESAKQYETSTSFCQQALGANSVLCGGCKDSPTPAPVPSPEPNESVESGTNECVLCPDGMEGFLPDKEIDIMGDDFPFPTCGFLNFAVGSIDGDSEECTIAGLLASFCGCQVVEEPCSLCPDGTSVPDPQQPVTFFEGAFGFAPSCGLMESISSSFDSKSETCEKLQEISGLCGCSNNIAVEERCNLCSGNLIMNTPDKVLLNIDREVLDNEINPSCQDLDNILTNVHESETECAVYRLTDYLCCVDADSGESERTYFSADTDAKKILLAWMPRVSGLLSLLGSCLIIKTYLSSTFVGGKRLYHLIIFLMSIYDISNSVSWILSTWAIYSVNEFGEETLVYGSHGTEGTCTAQGFFLQLGYTGIFYQVSLALFFLFQVRYGWRKERLESLTFWLAVIPSIIGILMALVGLPKYESTLVICHITAPPFADSWSYAGILIVIPILLAGICISILTIAVSRSNKRLYEATDEPVVLDTSLVEGQNQDNVWSMKQIWFYFFSYMATWPINLLPRFLIGPFARNELYWLWVLFVALAPLQGFWTACIYFGFKGTAMRPRAEIDQKPVYRGTPLEKDRTSIAVRTAEASVAITVNTYEDDRSRSASTLSTA